MFARFRLSMFGKAVFRIWRIGNYLDLCRLPLMNRTSTPPRTKRQSVPSALSIWAQEKRSGFSQISTGFGSKSCFSAASMNLPSSDDGLKFIAWYALTPRSRTINSGLRGGYV